MYRAGLLALAVVRGACRAGPAGQAPVVATAVPLFGPVLGPEVIAGRADAGDEVVGLAGGIDLVRLNLRTRHVARVSLRAGPSEECWNLARLRDGSLWTIKGRRTLARLEPDGTIAQEVTLTETHFGLFAAGDRLLFQRADFTPPAPALLAGAPDNPSRVPWSAIATRTFPSLARASVAALNMVTCGPSLSAERACWFPDEAAVSLVKDDGATRRVTLEGLEAVAPEVLLTSDNPRRPVRDAYVDAAGELWVLSSGMPPQGGEETPGGWVLARYALDDTAGHEGPSLRSKGIARLSEAARLILRADSRVVVLLLSSGKVGEVSRW